jgi:hypothetical protein
MMQPTAPCSPAPPVPRDHDPVFDINAKFGELLVVLGRSVIHVHEIGGHVAIGGIGVERRQLPGIARIRIVGDNRLLQARDILVGLHEFDDAFGRIGHERLELLDRGIEAPRLEFAEDVLGDLATGGAAGVVRLGGDGSHVLAQILWRRNRLQPLFEVTLGGDVCAGKSAYARGLLRSRWERRQREVDNR